MVDELYLALDVGGSNIRACLGDGSGFVGEEPVVVSSDYYWSEEGLVELVYEVADRYNQSVGDIEGIGMGISGLVDTENNEVALSYGLDELEFGNLKELDADLQIENDANAAVIGEKTYGAGKDVENLVTVIIGSGVGAGIYYDGELLGSTSNGRSPEPANILVDKETTWEEALGGENMPQYVKKWCNKSQIDTELSERADAETVFQKAKSTPKITEHLSELNAKGIETIVNLFAPEKITFSGSVAVENPEFMGNSFDKIDETINPKPEMEVSNLGNDLGLYGALAIAQNKI